MKNNMIKKITNLLLLLFISFTVSCTNKSEKDKIYVYNWGLYIDESVIEEFSDKYNCEVIYDLFDTNEEMYTILKDGARVYDAICPTDYMIEKMDNQNLLYHYDLNELNNYKLIDKNVLNIMKCFDKSNTIAVPYVYSTLGIAYNKTILDEKDLPYPTKWSDLWNPVYKGELLLQDAMRDLLMVGLKKNNFSMNTVLESEINIAMSDLINQKPLVNAYMIDTLRDKMVQGDGSISSMYSGEMQYIKEEGYKYNKYEYEYILPEEGCNLTIDCWVIPKNAHNKELAKKWINFMLEPEIALKNFDYMHYGIANLGTIELLKERKDSNKMLSDEAIFPDLSDISKYEIYKDLGNTEELYNNAFKKIKS